MKNFNILSIILRISVSANFYDPFIRTVWVNIHGEDTQASATGASYHAVNAVASAIFEAMLFVLANPRDNRAVSTLDVEVRAESNTHTATLTRVVFPMETAAEVDPEPAPIETYSFEIERYIDHCMDAMRTDTAEMLKSLAAAHFDDTAGGEGNGYVISRRGVTPEP